MTLTHFLYAAQNIYLSYLVLSTSSKHDHNKHNFTDQIGSNVGHSLLSTPVVR